MKAFINKSLLQLKWAVSYCIINNCSYAWISQMNNNHVVVMPVGLLGVTELPQSCGCMTFSLVMSAMWSDIILWLLGVLRLDCGPFVSLDLYLFRVESHRRQDSRQWDEDPKSHCHCLQWFSCTSVSQLNSFFVIHLNIFPPHDGPGAFKHFNAMDPTL